MPTRRKRPLNFVARGVSDAVDSTNSPRGSMSALTNLIPAPHTRGQFVPRPASLLMSSFPGFNTAGQISAIFPNGSRIYGMISTSDFAGYDVPFCFDAAAQRFIPITNIAQAFLPLTPQPTGDWTPPTIEMVGTRIVVTHPGFSGGANTANPSFGWFDISNFRLGTLTGNETNGSKILDSIAGDGTSAPINDGVSIGQMISGPGIPSNTFITKVVNGSFNLNTTGNTMTGQPLLFNVAAITDAQGNPLKFGMYVKASGVPIGTQVVSTGQFKLKTVGNIRGQFSLATTGNISQASDTITNVADVNGVVAGMTISGPGIPANTTVSAVTVNTIQMSQLATASTVAAPISITQLGANTITNVGSVTGVWPGMKVTGTGIPNNTIVTQVSSSFDTGALGNVVTINNLPTLTLGNNPITFDGGNVINLSQAALNTLQGSAVNVSGGGQIYISNAATATANGVQFVITGGTPSAPLWYAGNMNQNPLPTVPSSVASFNGRAYYSCGNAIIVSDSLNAVQNSNASFVLTLGDNQPITAVEGLPLDNQVTGGVIQSIIAFKGASGIFQITGDPALGNWASNALNVSTGTFAPNTVVPTPLGLAFMAPDGLRIIDFNANVGDPIGAFGEGVSVPFINAVSPSRMCAAYNQNVLRITVNNNAAGVAAIPQEYWYDFTLKIWTGPHTFPFGLIAAFYAKSAYSSGHGFVGTGWQVPAALWSGEVTPLNPQYVENGTQLEWVWETSLLPDNAGMSMNAVIETALGLIVPVNSSFYITASDEAGRILDGVTINGPTGTPTIWGQFVWGQGMWLVMVPPTIWGDFYWGEAPWQQQFPFYQQYPVNWHNPIVFKQMQITISGMSLPFLSIGNLYLGYEPLGYMIEGPPEPVLVPLPP